MILESLLLGVGKEFLSGAVDQVARFFGVPTSGLEDSLRAASSDDLERLRVQLEQYKVQMSSLARAAELDVDLRKSVMLDIQSARQVFSGSRLMVALAGGVLVVNVALVVIAFSWPSSMDHPGLMALVGAHTSAMTLVLSYFFGSSVPGNRA